MQLLVNVDHVATLRNARGEGEPSPAEAAIISEDAGAAGIVFHLREDRRHVRDADVWELKRVIRGVVDFEMAATDEMVSICRDLKPHVATLVPEKRMELTTEGGLDMHMVFQDFKDRVVPALKDAGVGISLFIDPNPRDIELAHKLGVEAIELHTGTYAMATSDESLKRELAQLIDAATRANDAGLLVNAGHGLNFSNTFRFASEVPYLHDISIGHALISRSVFTGLGNAVSEMNDIIQKAASIHY